METNDLEHLFRKQVESVGALSGTFGRLSQQLAKQKEEEEKTRSALTKAIGNVRSGWNFIKEKNKSIGHKIDNTSQQLSVLGKSANDALHAFEAFARGGVIGTIIGQMSGYFGDLTQTYKRMSEIGQRFEGNFFEMTRTAARSGMTLEEFAEMVEKNSTMLVQFEGGAKQFGKLTSSVRQATERFGMFGYSVSGLNELMGEYFETMRLGGRLSEIDQDRASRHLVELADNTSALSILFGKSRKQITAESQQAQRNALLLSRRFSMTAKEQQDFDDKFGKIFDALTAQAGEAGTALGNMFAEIAGAGGSSAHSSIANMFREAGLTEVPGLMEEAYARIAAGEDSVLVHDEMIGKILDSAAGSMDTLNAQIRGNNQSAVEVQKIISNMKRVTPDDRKKAIENARRMEPLTKAMNNFANVWSRLSGMIRNEAIGVFAKLIDGITKGVVIFDSAGGFTRIINNFKEIGAAIGKWFSGKEIENASEAFTTITLTMLNGADSFVNWIKELIVNFTNKYDSFGEIFEGEIIEPLRQHFNDLVKYLKSMLPTFQQVMLGLVGLGAVLTMLKGVNLAHKVRITAATVYVNGKGGGLGGLGDFDGEDRKKGKNRNRPGSFGSRGNLMGRIDPFLLGTGLFYAASGGGHMTAEEAAEDPYNIQKKAEYWRERLGGIDPTQENIARYKQEYLAKEELRNKGVVIDGEGEGTLSWLWRKMTFGDEPPTAKVGPWSDPNYVSPEGRLGTKVNSVSDGDLDVLTLEQRMREAEAKLEKSWDSNDTKQQTNLIEEIKKLHEAIVENTAINFQKAQQLIEESRRSSNALNNSISSSGR